MTTLHCANRYIILNTHHNNDAGKELAWHQRTKPIILFVLSSAVHTRSSTHLGDDFYFAH